MTAPTSVLVVGASVAGLTTATDQFGARVQVHGTPSADAEVTVVEGSLAERRFVAVYRRQRVVSAALGWNTPKQARGLRRELVYARPASESEAAAGSTLPGRSADGP